MDMQPRKIPMATIEQLQRVLENVPECRVEEVTKVQAIRMLASQIHAMQSKGYGLVAIAKLLSEHGIGVTAVTLKSYLTQAKAAGGKKKAPKRKQRQESDGARSDIPISTSPSAVAPSDAAERSGTREARGAGARVEKVVRDVAPPVAAIARAKESPKGTPRQAEGGAQRRSAFVPKEDSDDN
jgi:hypothetical protein